MAVHRGLSDVSMSWTMLSRIGLAVCVAVMCAATLVGADEPTPTSAPLSLATPTPSPDPRPRFGVEVVGRPPQEALQEYLTGFDPCEPVAVDHRVPTIDQMAERRPRPSPSVDLLRVFRALFREGNKHLHKKRPGRYLLYRVARREGVTYRVNDGLLREADRFQPGATVDMLAAFPDRKSATRARERLERGGALLEVLRQRCGEERSRSR
jgi:hypothetical protein